MLASLLVVLMIASCAEACHRGCVGQYYVRMPHVRKPCHYSITIAAPCLWHADPGCVWLCGCGCVAMGLCVFVVATVVTQRRADDILRLASNGRVA